MPTAGDTRPAEYALLVKGEFATTERRRTVILALPAAHFSFTLARSAAFRSPSMVHIEQFQRDVGDPGPEPPRRRFDITRGMRHCSLDVTVMPCVMDRVPGLGQDLNILPRSERNHLLLHQPTPAGAVSGPRAGVADRPGARSG